MEEKGTLPNLFHEVSVTTIPKQRQCETNQTCRIMSLMNIDVKILNKTLANCIQQYIKRIMHYNKVGFIPRLQG